MEKIIIWILLGFSLGFAETHLLLNPSLENDCLQCHQNQQIPSNLIYKRYLMQYSTEKAIEKAMFNYLTHPLISNSIMPPQFFLKFPMKEKSMVADEVLKVNIKAYIKHFDVKQYLRIQK